MDVQSPVQSLPQEPAKGSGFPKWLIAVIVVIVLCCCVSFLIIFVLTLLGPMVGNVFSTINQSLTP